MVEGIKQRQHVVNGPARRPRTAEGDALSGLAIGVLRVAGYLTQAGDALSKPFGQTSARWQVLAAAANAPLSVAQIARVLGLSRQAVQRLADLLEADGLARYEDNPAHQRAKLLTLTPAGEKTLADIQAKQAVWANALGARIGEADLLQAQRIVQRVLEVLEAHPVADV